MCMPSDRPGLVAELLAIVVTEALIGVDLSVDDWGAVLTAHNGALSTRRALFDESARLQVDLLSSGVYDDSATNADLARRIEALPVIQKVAVLDVIDRFWSPEAPKTGELRARLEALGVVFPEKGIKSSARPPPGRPGPDRRRFRTSPDSQRA